MLALRHYAILLLWLCCVCATAVAHAQSEPLASDINETVVSMPVIVHGKPSGSQMVGTVFRPGGEGPFPFVVLNHGRASSHIERYRLGRARYLIASRWLVQRGLVVFVPTRRGYGETGGADVERSYDCTNPSYTEAMDGGVQSVMSAVEFARQQPFVDKSRYVIMGQSVGGYLSVGAGALNPEGLLGIVNFAGGHGGRPEREPGNPCAAEKLKRVFAEAGKTSRAPALWVYTENDQYFSAEHTRAWHDAFVAGGGKAEFRLLPPFGKDGHTLFVRGATLWQPVVAEFLKSIGL